MVGEHRLDFYKFDDDGGGMKASYEKCGVGEVSHPTTAKLYVNGSLVETVALDSERVSFTWDSTSGTSGEDYGFFTWTSDQPQWTGGGEVGENNWKVLKSR